VGPAIFGASVLPEKLSVFTHLQTQIQGAIMELFQENQGAKFMKFLIATSPKKNLFLGELGVIVPDPQQALPLDKFQAIMLINALVREYPHARLVAITD
jgi:hypothetical protein